jgi:uncharacterized protein (TIGR01777 family)
MPCGLKSSSREKAHMRVFMTGATGLVGTRLVKRLLARGEEVVALTRRPAVARDLFGSGVTAIEGDPAKPGDWMTSVASCDSVISLVGENIFGRRWNAAFKQVLVESRVKSTQNVAQALTASPRRSDGSAKAFVTASAIGFYGPHGDEELTETSPPGTDFLAQLCVDWENASRAVEVSGVRRAIVRVGVVLDKQGGAMAKLLTPFKFGVGGPVGSGKQWMSWIHNDDLATLFLLALDNPQASGPLNGTAPEPVTNRDFSKALGRALHRPAFLPTPGFALRLGLGEVADVITSGQRVLPKQSLALGMQFQFPGVDAALADVVR